MRGRRHSRRIQALRGRGEALGASPRAGGRARRPRRRLASRRTTAPRRAHPRVVAAEAAGALLVGCTGGGVIGAGHESRRRCGLAHARAARSRDGPFHLDTTDLPAASAPPPTWHAAIGVAPQARPKFLSSRPVTLDASALLAGLDVAYPARASSAARQRRDGARREPALPPRRGVP